MESLASSVQHRKFKPLLASTDFCRTWTDAMRDSKPIFTTQETKASTPELREKPQNYFSKILFETNVRDEPSEKNLRFL